jgi:putative MATE family efflux protein
VLISRHFGAKNPAEVRNTLHTAILLAIIMGVIITAVGVAFSPALLKLVQTPESVFNDAAVYLRIYFSGTVSLTIYNMGAAILMATGDTKRPLYFLMLSFVVNMAVKFVFVLHLGMGIAGVAWSTVISQTLCAALILLLLSRSATDVRLHWKQFRIHKHIFKDVLKIGLPGGIQGAVISGSNLIVQSYINRLGAVAAAGYSAGTRLDGYITVPIFSMTAAASTFTAQNLGAGNVRRARRGVLYALTAGVVGTMVLSALAVSFARQFVGIFTEDAEVLAIGVQFMWVFVPCYFLLCFSQILPGALRGAGQVKFPTFACLGCLVVMRQIYLYVVTQFHFTPVTVALGFPVTWAICAVFIGVYYARSDWGAFEKEPEEPAVCVEGTDKVQ